MKSLTVGVIFLNPNTDEEMLAQEEAARVSETEDSEMGAARSRSGAWCRCGHCIALTTEEDSIAAWSGISYTAIQMGYRAPSVSPRQRGFPTCCTS